MQILDVLDQIAERARHLPDAVPVEAVIRVRFVRRRGSVETLVDLSDGRTHRRGRGHGTTPESSLLDAVA
jgi:hypothetical protein